MILAPSPTCARLTDPVPRRTAVHKLVAQHVQAVEEDGKGINGQLARHSHSGLRQVTFEI